MVTRPYVSFPGWGRFFIIAAAAVFLLVNAASSEEQSETAKAERYRVFSLRNISAEAGKEYLAKINTGTVSVLPGKNMLLVTAQPMELLKAAAILALVDTNDAYTIEKIFSASQASDLPTAARITAETSNMSVGTFTDPPVGNKKAKAIVDVHGEDVLAIAPVGRVPEIVAAIEKIRQGTTAAKGEAVKTQEPNAVAAEVNEPLAVAAAKETLKAEAVSKEEVKSDELFGELLKSITAAEEKAVKTLQTEQKEQDKAAEIAAEPNVIPKTAQEQGGSLIDKFSEDELTELLQGLLAKKKAQSAAAAGIESNEPALAPLEMTKEANTPQDAYKRSYEPETVPEGDAELTLDLPDQLEINQLLSLAGQYLGLDYMYDAGKVAGMVSLNLRGPIKVKDLYPLLESVLKFKGFVMTRKNNLVTIVPVAEALSIDPALQTDERKIRLGEVVITKVIQLKYVDTASAKNLLDGMQLGANITSIEGTKTLIVTEYAYRMGRIEELLAMIDKPGEPKKFKFRQLKYTMATVLAPKIEALVEQLAGISITVGETQAPGQAAGQQGQPVPGQTSVRGQPRRTPPRATPPGAATAAPPGEVSVYLDADERTNRILMIGYESQLAVVEELIDSLDIAQQDLRSLKLYDIQFVGAAEVLQKLQELGIVTATTMRGGYGGYGTGMSARAEAMQRLRSQRMQQEGQQIQQQQMPGTTMPGMTSTNEQTPVEEPQVVIIESTNSLLVNATPEQHIQIAMIIGYVDSETLQKAINYIIYPLANVKPEDLAEVLQKLIQETIQDKEGKIEQIIPRQEDQIVIVPDKSTFSLVVYASKKNQEWIGNLIQTLDKRRPQVLIDVTLVEISRTDLFDMDLQLVTKSGGFTPGGTMESGGLVKALVSPFPTQDVLEASSISGTGTAFYSDGHIQALLTALQTKSYGRVLAKPKVLVNDGQAGTIETTTTTNVAIETVTPGGPTSNPIQSTTYQPYTAGITLTITPNISEGDLLLLEVEMTRSDFQDPPVAGAPPDTIESNIKTIVTVPNDRTIILGGMIKLNQSKGGTKVPLLGDIPLIGGLFRSTSDSARDSKLYIFVKANILRPDETLRGLPELETISARNAAAFEKAETKFQELEGWPGIKPTPLDPLKVLETE